MALVPKPDHRSQMARAWLHFHAARKGRGSGVQPRVSTGRSIHAVPSITPSLREGIENSRAMVRHRRHHQPKVRAARTASDGAGDHGSVPHHHRGRRVALREVAGLVQQASRLGVRADPLLVSGRFNRFARREDNPTRRDEVYRTPKAEGRHDGSGACLGAGRPPPSLPATHPGTP